MTRSPEHQGKITHLLNQWEKGDPLVLEKLTSLIYPQIKQIAQYHLNMERDGLILSGTDLAHEAFIRLLGMQRTNWRDRLHFFAVAAKIIRNILTDFARTHRSVKRQARMDPYWEGVQIEESTLMNFILLDRGLIALAKLDQRKVWVVEMRYYVGMQLAEIAKVLSISLATVKRDLSFSRAWLRKFWK